MKRIILAAGIICMLISPAVHAEGAVSEQSVRSILIGTSKSDVYAAIGNADKVSANGMKDTYFMTDGKTAVFQYSADILVHGYILVN